MTHEELTFDLGAEDFEQAQWLAVALHHEWRYDFSKKKWYHWDGIRWAIDTKSHILSAIARTAYYSMRPHPEPPVEATHVSNGGDVKVRRKLLGVTAQKRVIEALATFPGYSTDGSDWDQNPYLLGCTNGVVDLRTNTLNKHPLADCLVTKSTGHPFTPGLEPVRFVEFLYDVMSDDKDMFSFLLEWFGSGMFGFTPEEKFLIMTGIGGNGKGSLKDAVLAAIGDYGAQVDSNMYSRSRMGSSRADGAHPEWLDLKGKRIVFCSEPDKGQFNEELLKAHTGGDRIKARTLWSDVMVEWLPTHSITFLTNDAPSIEDVGDSMERRVMVADFRENYKDRKDLQLKSVLSSEGPAVLSLLCQAASIWYQRFESGQGIVEPARVLHDSAHFLSQNDVIGNWMSECCAAAEGFTQSSRAAYESYTSWHGRVGEHGDPMSMVKWSAALDKHGFSKSRNMDGVHWRGFHLLNAMERATLGADDE